MSIRWGARLRLVIGWQIQDVSFKQQRENDLLQSMLQAVDESNTELFQQKLSQ